MCPRSVTYQVGSKATISCSLQIPTPTSRPTVDIYLIDDYEGNRQTLLSQEQIPENGTLVKKSEVFNASMEVSVDGNGLMLIDVSYESIKCCYQGNLWISISGHLMVQIEVNVTGKYNYKRGKGQFSLFFLGAFLFRSFLVRITNDVLVLHRHNIGLLAIFEIYGK